MCIVTIVLEGLAELEVVVSVKAFTGHGAEQCVWTVGLLMHMEFP